MVVGCYIYRKIKQNMYSTLFYVCKHFEICITLSLYFLLNAKLYKVISWWQRPTFKIKNDISFIEIQAQLVFCGK